jgi:hypothetical protein
MIHEKKRQSASPAHHKERTHRKLKPSRVLRPLVPRVIRGDGDALVSKFKLAVWAARKILLAPFRLWGAFAFRRQRRHA